MIHFTIINSVEVIITFPPQIIEFPKNISQKIYFSTNLTCRAVGLPLPVIEWYKDDRLVANDNIDQSVLLFPELSLNDRGFYYCQAKNTINGIIHLVNSSKVLLNITSTCST